MRMVTKVDPQNIIGIELKTTNENGKAFEDIPPFWQKFYQEGIIEKIPNKASSDVYAVYTNFENEGKNSKGVYSLIIGCPVSNLKSVPDGFVSTILPKSRYAVFESAKGKLDQVGETWQKIWNLSETDRAFDQNRSYQSEFELYQPSGEINIYIGMRSES